MDSPAQVSQISQKIIHNLLPQSPADAPASQRRITLPPLEGLEINSHQDLLTRLNWTKNLGSLTWLTKNKSEHYTVSRIPKKNGKFRVIHNPDGQMRRLQWRVCSEFLNQIPIPEYIWGFERGKSVPKMAEIHRGKAVVISLDIRDFFPSIKQREVKEVFQQLGVHHVPSATVLSEICTYKSYVPQGALTSPKISNVIASATFGPQVKAFADAHGLTMSIYADDITYSFNEVPAVVEGSPVTQKDFVRRIINFTKSTLEKFGFRLNYDKIKVMRRYNRQWVCGAVVNDKVNLIKRDRARLRAIVHNCEMNGISAEAARTGAKELEFIQKIGGKLNWYRQLNPEKGTPIYTRFKTMSQPLTKQFPGFDLDRIVYDSSIENPQTQKEMEAI